MMRILKWIGIVIVAILAIGLVWRAVDPEGFEKARAKGEAERAERARERQKTGGASAPEGEADARRHPEQLVKVDMKWSDNNVSVMTAEFTIRNGNGFPVRDVQVECALFAPSGTQVGSVSQTIYEQVPGNGFKRVPEINLGFIDQQASTASCDVTEAVAV